MKLICTREQPSVLGLPISQHEWWDLGDGYEIFVIIGQKSANLTITASDKKSITLEVAKYLGVDTKTENITLDSRGRELYLYPSIDCVVLNYLHPEKYKELLLRIEEIVNKHFKSKKANLSK